MGPSITWEGKTVTDEFGSNRAPGHDAGEPPVNGMADDMNRDPAGYDDTTRGVGDRTSEGRSSSFWNPDASDGDGPTWGGAPDETRTSRTAAAPRASCEPAAGWRRPAAVTLLLALLAALTFAGVTMVVRSHHEGHTTPAIDASRTSSPVASPSAPSSSSSSTSASRTSSTAPSRATTPPPVAPVPAPTQATQAPTAPTTAVPAPPASPSAPTASSPSGSDGSSEPADTPFPPTTGRHCITDTGTATSTTETDVRQALTRTSSCALLLTVRDAVHSKTATDPSATSYQLTVFSAYRKRVKPSSNGFIALSCSRNGVFVTCTSVDPPVEIWVRDAS